MALIEFIEHLQQKPEPVRRRIMAVSVTSIMAIIIFFWVLTLQYNLDVRPQDQGTTSKADISPFTLLGESIMQNVNDLGKKLFNK